MDTGKCEPYRALDFDDLLQNHPEGKLGKLRLHKSGKVTMLIGNVPFEVQNGLECFFKQTVVSVSNNPDAAYVELGEVGRRFLCTPDIESMLQE